MPGSSTQLNPATAAAAVVTIGSAVFIVVAVTVVFRPDTQETLGKHWLA